MRDRGNKSQEQIERESWCQQAKSSALQLERIRHLLAIPHLDGGPEIADEVGTDLEADEQRDDDEETLRRRQAAQAFFRDPVDDDGELVGELVEQYLADLEPRAQIRKARSLGERSGPYRELTWLYSHGPGVRAPRILAANVPRDKEAELDASDLINLDRSYSSADGLLERNVRAVDLALPAMRPCERSVLLRRLSGRQGKRREGDATWHVVAFESGLPSAPIAKEVFKVAVREFLAHYARIVKQLVQEDKS